MGDVLSFPRKPFVQFAFFTVCISFHLVAGRLQSRQHSPRPQAVTDATGRWSEDRRGPTPPERIPTLIHATPTGRLVSDSHSCSVNRTHCRSVQLERTDQVVLEEGRKRWLAARGENRPT